MFLSESGLLIQLVTPVHVVVNAAALACTPATVCAVPLVLVEGVVDLACVIQICLLGEVGIELRLVGGVLLNIVQIADVFPGIHHLHRSQRLVPAEGVVVMYLSLALGTGFGGNQDNAERSARTID